jgi:multicomponent Na+:H+ antiporter subunit D
MHWLIAAPILWPLLTACVLITLWRHRAAQRWIDLAGMIALAALALALLSAVYQSENQILAVQMGGYAAPYGITFVADLFSSIMVFATAVMGVAVAVYSLPSVGARRESFGYHPLLQLLIMGVCGAFLTGDMFNLYVFFEIMLMASFVLLTLGGERGQIEGAIKYVTLNLISSAVFLAGVGILYGITGTLNMADLAFKVHGIDEDKLFTVVGMLFMIAFGVKAAMFPLFFWLPASYHTPPPAVSAIFAALLTKVGVYALVRVFTLIFSHEPQITHKVILVLAGLGMICGVLGAAAQNEFRRILAFHSVSQIGYMLMGLGLFTVLAHRDDEVTRAAVQLALAGTIIFVIHHLVVKPNLFLISGIVERLGDTGELKKLGGFYRHEPFLAALFIISAMSLAGIPPLSGFWAKLVLIKAGLQLEHYVIVAAALATGLLTLFSMVKIWAAVFWAAPADGSPLLNANERAARKRGVIHMIGPISAMAAIIVLFGVFAGPIFDLAHDAAGQLMNPEIYKRAVLGDTIETSTLEIETHRAGDAAP